MNTKAAQTKKRNTVVRKAMEEHGLTAAKIESILAAIKKQETETPVQISRQVVRRIKEHLPRIGMQALLVRTKNGVRVFSEKARTSLRETANKHKPWTKKDQGAKKPPVAV